MADLFQLSLLTGGLNNRLRLNDLWFCRHYLGANHQFRFRKMAIYGE